VLTHKVTKRVELKDEGEWIEIRMPSFAILQRFSTSEDPVRFLQDCILKWSYSEPLTPELVEELDADSVALLVEALHETVNEKNSAGRSTVT